MLGDLGDLGETQAILDPEGRPQLSASVLHRAWWFLAGWDLLEVAFAHPGSKA